MAARLPPPFDRLGFLNGAALPPLTERRARRWLGEHVAGGRYMEASSRMLCLGSLGLFFLLVRSWNILRGVSVYVAAGGVEAEPPRKQQRAPGRVRARSTGPCPPPRPCRPRLLAEPAASQLCPERPCDQGVGTHVVPILRMTKPWLGDDSLVHSDRHFYSGHPSWAARSPQGAASRPRSALRLSLQHGGP